MVNTKGCRIPDLNILDPKINRFIFKERAIECGKVKPLVNSNQTHLFLEHSALPGYNVSYPEELLCCFRPFWRQDGHPADKGLR